MPTKHQEPTVGCFTVCKIRELEIAKNGSYVKVWDRIRGDRIDDDDEGFYDNDKMMVIIIILWCCTPDAT